MNEISPICINRFIYLNARNKEIKNQSIFRLRIKKISDTFMLETLMLLKTFSSITNAI